MKNNDIIFIRRNGRIIPIRKKPKNDPVAIAAATGGTAATLASASKAATLLKKSNEFYRESAIMRGYSKTAKFGPENFIKRAARYKILGKKFSTRSALLLSAGTVAASIAGYGIGKLAATKQEDVPKFSTAATGAVGAAGLLLFSRKAGISHLLKGINIRKGTGAVKDIFNAWSKEGARKTAETVKAFIKRKPSGPKFYPPVRT